METNCQAVDTNPKYLFDQLITARKEINNLRQQIKSLRYVHERDVSSIKKLMGLCTSGYSTFPEESASSNAPSTLARDIEPSTSKFTSCEVSLNFRPIGTISTWFPNKRGTPRQPIICGNTPGKLRLFKNILTNPDHALEGLEEFSHMWILFHFHKNEPGHVRAKVAPPRLNGVRTGVFSTRSPHRPCPIGLSLVKIIKIEDCTIYFEGVDMVDQTPVLDIKPYIPHYDNPLHVEKMIHTINPKEDNNTALSVASCIDDVDTWITSDVDEAASINIDDTLLNNQRIIDYTNSIRENDSTAHSPLSSTSAMIDISRDAELALRLQAEEFQSNLNFENVYVSSESSSILEDNELAEIIASRTNLNAMGYSTADAVNSNNDDQNPRTSRLLDGADGPSAVCGTDLDLINRHALNLRLDDSSSSSSPIRMGVREAPDGEEGFDFSQSQIAQASRNTNTGVPGETVSDGAVRVPDWISRPKTATLSVVFNERALTQLREILSDKADEKRFAVENVLKEDPRSVYLRQRYGNQFYTFLIHDLHITCKFDDDRKIVTVFQVRHAGRTCECGQPEWQCPGHGPVFNHDQ